MNTRIILIFFLVIIAFFSLVFSLFKGSFAISLTQFFDSLGSKKDPLLQQIIFSIRMPRALSAFVTGGLLALAGALMQILLRNALADPYVLGISGGAAVAMLLLLWEGVTHSALLMGGAWVGSLVAILLLFMLTNRRFTSDKQRILLTGIGLSSAFAAFIGLMLSMSPEHELRSMLFWLMGDLSYAHWPIFESVLLLMGLVIALAFARELNIVQRGEQQAKTLGVNTERLQLILYLLASILTAAAVTLGGCIGFVGLIIPHLLRLAGLQDYRFLLPAAVLLGGALLTFADTLARSLLSPQTLPVGIVMALIGIPIFLCLLQKQSAL